MNILPVDKEQIPYEAEFVIQDETFTFEFNYNEQGDFFTVDLIKNGQVLALGEKLVYGRPLFQQYANREFPKQAIIPLDPSQKQTEVNYETLGESIFLYVISKDEIDAILS